VKKNSKTKTKLRYKTVFLSDTHLGMRETGIKKLNHFLAHIRCDTLILNGDFIDGWALKRSGGWKKEHTRCIRLILKMVEKRKTKVIYLRGNHDDFISTILPFAFDRIHIFERYVFQGSDRKYLVLHGDCFDSFSTKRKWIAKVGSVGYDNLMRFNRIYNRYRKLRGKKPFSLSAWAKAKVKGAVNHVHRYEESLADMARKFNCKGMICGHIHVASDRMIGNVRYLNSGDWVESNTCIVEKMDGELSLLSYPDFLKELSKQRAVRNLNDSVARINASKEEYRNLSVAA
jgi:UDP-2,3-diacylglucosamine pyrophosphatase LpxH